MFPSKRTAQLLGIFKKERHDPVPELAKPTNNHRNLRQMLFRPCARAEKRTAQQLGIFKK
jgi:hypothetical protein